MTAADIHSIRQRLNLSQVQMAQLLGVHPLTISKWERGVLRPSPHQEAMMASFGQAARREGEAGEEAKRLLVSAGVAYAVYKLLEAAFKDA